MSRNTTRARTGSDRSSLYDDITNKIIGEIEVGMDADLTVLAADPAEDIEALADVVYTIRAGRVIFGPRP